MDTLGIEATPEEVDLMIDEIDQDNNGEIDFEGMAVADTFEAYPVISFVCCIVVVIVVVVVDVFFCTRLL